MTLESEFFAKGMLVGFSVSAPIGPIGILCIRRTLAHGWSSGLGVGIGAAMVDGMFALVAAFGLTVVSGALLPYQTLLRIVGGAFLLYLGGQALRLDPRADPAASRGPSVAAGVASGFLLLVTNPVAILVFTAVFAGFGLTGAADDRTAATAIVLGVLTGALLWWLVLNLSVAGFRSRIDARILRWVNIGSGVLLAAFGVAAIAGVVE